jgi:hypothetical protein
MVSISTVARMVPRRTPSWSVGVCVGGVGGGGGDKQMGGKGGRQFNIETTGSSDGLGQHSGADGASAHTQLVCWGGGARRQGGGEEGDDKKSIVNRLMASGGSGLSQ